MDCPHSSSETCSSGAAVNLTCSEPLRLVGGASRCAGTVEVRHRGEWRRMEPDRPWLLEDTAAVCRDLDCGSAVYGEEREDFPQSPVWRVSPDCVEKSAVRHCVYGSSSSSSSSSGLEVKCSDLLNRPVISLSVSDGVSEALPQGVRVLLGSKFQGQMLCGATVPGRLLPAPLSNRAPRFSSQSPSLQLSLGASDSALIIRVLLILLLKLLYILPMLYYYCKVRARGRR
ncbi:scavenger receptor cysteine-rich type 1 protein M130-like [Periophthalmus magnuspinnatus]|uniref:scavenger receptor cysteine-rich type 1 protein M130-like n=1 Tax=Periophthalmus magnuspinnatus TaxID=409849 RepID=UPI002436AAC7|nr:scavenger receptor cysteine-rich type 1 protein M130-like [Periophthalmus magnuspinnatus]